MNNRGFTREQSFNVHDVSEKQIMDFYLLQKFLEELDIQAIRQLTAEQFLNLFQEVCSLGVNFFGDEFKNMHARNAQTEVGETITDKDDPDYGMIRSKRKIRFPPKLFMGDLKSQIYFEKQYLKGQNLKRKFSIPDISGSFALDNERKRLHYLLAESDRQIEARIKDAEVRAFNKAAGYFRKKVAAIARASSANAPQNKDISKV